MQLCLAVNRSADHPVALTLAGWRGRVRQLANAMMGGAGWAVNRLEADAPDAFSRNALVVLSPDADEALAVVNHSAAARLRPIAGAASAGSACSNGSIAAAMADGATAAGGWIDPASVLVIGGIVDRSPASNATRSFAAARGLRCARLPTGGRHLILNIDRVMHALVEVHQHGDWERALDAAVPRRLLQPPAVNRHRARATLLRAARTSSPPSTPSPSTGQRPPLSL